MREEGKLCKLINLNQVDSNFAEFCVATHILKVDVNEVQIRRV